MTATILSAVVAALLHITPTVVLVKRVDAVQRLLPGAQSYLAREVHLSDPDAHRLHEAVDWSPENGVVTFYLGVRGAATNVVGSLLFVRVDTPHGPIEVAVGFDPAGVVREVVVTKATVETKPWLLEALRAGLPDRYRGLKPGEAADGAAALRGHAGSLPVFMAEQTDKGVTRALAAYRLFFGAPPRAG